MEHTERTYSIYISDDCVELRPSDSDRPMSGHAVCSQKRYSSIVKIATGLANYKGLPFRNYVASEM